MRDRKPLKIEGLWAINPNVVREEYRASEKKENRKPLKIEDSWAIHPKLIPEECRVSDQPNFRLPIRKKTNVLPEKQ